MSSAVGVKAVVFDFGGVILDLFQDRTTLELYKHIPQERRPDVMELALMIELGKISGDEFLAGLRSFATSTVTIEEIERIWNLMLCEVKDEKVSFLRKLKANYKVYLLSNTNIVHKNHFDVTCFKAFGESMENFFEDTFYSHELEMRKPNEDIFSHVISSINLRPDEILFIDDLEDNTKTAAGLGMKTFTFARNESFDTLSFLEI